jgi:hypothetical protein
MSIYSVSSMTSDLVCSGTRQKRYKTATHQFLETRTSHRQMYECCVCYQHTLLQIHLLQQATILQVTISDDENCDYRIRTLLLLPAVMQNI